MLFEKITRCDCGSVEFLVDTEYVDRESFTLTQDEAVETAIAILMAAHSAPA